LPFSVNYTNKEQPNIYLFPEKVYVIVKYYGFPFDDIYLITQINTPSFFKQKIHANVAHIFCICV